MGWSMASVSFRMAGPGNWQSLLPDEETRRLYAQIYPGGIPLTRLASRYREVIQGWQEADIAAIAGQRLVPLCPIMTNQDLEILAPWFRDISGCMCQAIWHSRAGYELLAADLDRY